MSPPLGFSTSSRQLRRAGLDYWEGVDVQEIQDLEAYLESTSSPFYFFSSKGSRTYSDIQYAPDAILIFGAETNGLPEWVFERWPERCLQLPMQKGSRCLNLSNTVAVALYEAWRQNNFCFDFDLKP